MNLKTAFTLKRIFLAFAIVILLLCIAFVSILLIKHHKKLDRFNKAKQAYLDEKYEDAKPLLIACLKDQYNDEEVNVMLAKIAENEEQWPQAVLYWQRATKLNSFKTEYFDSYLEALKMTRDFQLIVEALELKNTQNKLTQEQYLLLAFSQYATEGHNKVQETLENVTDENVKKQDLAVILYFFLKQDSQEGDISQKIEQTLNFLQKYHDSSDKFIAFETLYVSALQYARKHDLENGRKCMEKAAQISPSIGRPLLGFYYYQNGYISDAMTIFEDYVTNYTPNEIGVTLGECYVITQQPDKLAELRKKFTSGNNNRITTGLYLEALHAFMVQDVKTLSENIIKWQDSHSSTIATLVKLYSAAATDNLEETKKYLLAIQKLAPNIGIAGKNAADAAQSKDDKDPNKVTTLYFNSRNYAFNIAFRYISNLVSKNQTFRAGEIAEILKQFGPFQAPPNQPNPDVLLTELVTGYKLQKGTLKQEEVNDILAKYPGNPLLLNYITQYYRRQGEFDKAIQLAKANMKNLHEDEKKLAAEGKQPRDLTPFAVNLLSSLEVNYIKSREEALKLEEDGKKDEAQSMREKANKQLEETKKVAKDMLAEKDTIATNILYIDFCFRNSLLDELNEYSAEIKTDDSDDIKALKYFARAQMAVLPKKGTETSTSKMSQAEKEKLTDAEKEKLAEEEKKKQEEEFEKNKVIIAKHLDNIVTAHPSILYKIALLYAAFQHYEKANATYQKIVDQGKPTAVIYLNMSENYAGLNQNDKALEYAKKALDMAPNTPVVKEVYAIRLMENGGEKEVQQAYDSLDALVMAKTATDRGYYSWYVLQQKKLANLLETTDWMKIRTEANHLLTIFPQDTRGTEALKKAEKLMKEEMDKDKAEEEKKKAEEKGADQ